MPKLNVVLLVVLVGAAGVVFGYRSGEKAMENAMLAQAHREELMAEVVRQAVADNVSKIKVERVTIQQEVRREIVKEPVYVDCRNTPDGLRLINEALTGREPGSADSGELSGAHASL